jgi:hypothetical protein
MNASKRHKYFHTGLVIAIALLLLNPLPASSFQQNDGEGTAAGGEKAGDITMHTVSGRVIQTMDSGGYTYALVDGGGSKTWVALPKSRIAVGNEITCQPGMVMNNFNSASLNYTFKQIVFSSGLTSFSGGTAPPAAEPAPDEAPVVPKIKEPENWKDF